MKKSILIGIFFLFFEIGVCAADSVKFEWRRHTVQLTSAGDRVEIRIKGVFIAKIPVMDGESSETKFVDADYDGYPDIMVLREIGIEKHFDVYLFNKHKGGYEKNNFLSGLACPAFDKKTRTVRSTCNQASACEKWEETYRETHGGYVLISKRGKACDPSNGDAFKYEEHYKNGRVIWQKTSKISSR